MASDDPHTPAERAIRRTVEGVDGVGKPLSRSSLERERTVEGYLVGQEPPAWMRRARQIERLTERHERQLAGAREALRERHGPDAAAFARDWRAMVERWSFREVNQLIDAHNLFYPIERRLPVHASTGEYVPVGGGRSYRKEPLTAEWALQRFPAEP